MTQVGDGLADLDAGDALDGGGDALDVLDVEGGEDVDVGGEELLDVLVALGVFAALDVGVGELVDEDDLGAAGEDGVEVHLLEGDAAVLEVPAGHDGELLDELGGAGAAVGFDDADDDVLATALAADGLAEHVVGLADAGGVSEKEFESAAGLLRVCVFEPLLGSLGHFISVNQRAGERGRGSSRGCAGSLGIVTLGSECGRLLAANDTPPCRTMKPCVEDGAPGVGGRGWGTRLCGGGWAKEDVLWWGRGRARLARHADGIEAVSGDGRAALCHL